MGNERELRDILALMLALNAAIILFYSMICLVTPFRVCHSFAAYAFFSDLGRLPPEPWRMPLRAAGLYLLLCALILGKARWQVDRFSFRLAICVAEILLCVAAAGVLDFYYSGVALLVLADLVHYVRNNRAQLCFMAVLIVVFAFARYEIMTLFTSRIPFSAYLGYYSQPIRSFFTGVESVMVSLNTLLFVWYMILLFTGQRRENLRIQRLNRQLHDANDQLRDYAVKLERMTEVRERNRLAREIHDTLGHTLTGIIMGADAVLTLFDPAPEEAKKRVQVIAQSARDGLNDVRRSIKALRPDALEKASIEEALESLIANFHLTTSAEIQYEQLAGRLVLASDEEDTLYRVVQESMTNAVRHGHATEILVRLTRRDNLLTVEIWDNGLGCGDGVEEGFGLRHMRERLGLLGGSLTCGNREEEDGQRGFYLVVSLPVRGREEAQ